MINHCYKVLVKNFPHLDALQTQWIFILSLLLILQISSASRIVEFDILGDGENEEWNEWKDPEGRNFVQHPTPTANPNEEKDSSTAPGQTVITLDKQFHSTNDEAENMRNEKTSRAYENKNGSQNNKFPGGNSSFIYLCIAVLAVLIFIPTLCLLYQLVSYVFWKCASDSMNGNLFCGIRSLKKTRLTDNEETISEMTFFTHSANHSTTWTSFDCFVRRLRVWILV